MMIEGVVHNGVVVLKGGKAPPEGTRVTVSIPEAVCTSDRERKRVEFPLVRCKEPGSLDLTAERIAEVVNEEDAS